MATKRVLLLTTAQTYRAPDFRAAAERLGIAVVQAIDTPKELAGGWQGRLPLDFKAPAGAVATIAEHHAQTPFRAILAVDDSGSLLAARASEALGLPHNDPAAAEAARDKYRMRSLLAPAGVAVPWFRRYTTADDVTAIAREAPFPCVVKPLRRSGSQGVIRADDAGELAAALTRLHAILDQGSADPGPKPFLVEAYIPGGEVALEGLLDDGELHVLALFDKPDPLEGPFFEETIYVTPSRLPAGVQDAIATTTARAAAALGLRTGPIHAELRVNDDGPWLLEVAGRSIGGLCARTLRFGVDVSLEELILRQAVGMEIETYTLSGKARGVMMIPIPEKGLLRGVGGIPHAEAVPGIEGVEITARLNHPLIPLPEGDSYLGFIFAQGPNPATVETALRDAHNRLHFDIAPLLTLTPVASGR